MRAYRNRFCAVGVDEPRRDPAPPRARPTDTERPRPSRPRRPARAHKRTARTILPASWLTRRFRTSALTAILDALDKANVARRRAVSRATPRAPAGAHRLRRRASLQGRRGAEARRASRCARCSEHAPDAADARRRRSASTPALAERIYPRVVDKLTREPVEDFRIDFEDGFGNRPDDEEDRASRDARPTRSPTALRGRHAAAVNRHPDQAAQRGAEAAQPAHVRSLSHDAARADAAARCRRTSSSRCRRSRRPSRSRRSPSACDAFEYWRDIAGRRR